MDAQVRHLPRTTSYHNPIKISVHSCLSTNPLNWPFRFEAMWLKHETFDDLIAQVWGQATDFSLNKTLSLIEPLKRWNTNVFGHLRHWN